MDNLSIIAMIPARIGSTRLKMKNLALLDGKPLISYAIKAAKETGIFNRIVINSDHQVFKKIANRYHVEFYQRPIELGSSDTKSDNVVIDFIEKHPCDIIAWVNPTSPLQKAIEINEIVKYFLCEKLDSLITVKNEQVHCIYNEKPINFSFNEIFSQTQDLNPAQTFVYSVMMWRSKSFIREFEKNGHAFFCGKTGYFPVSKQSSVIIKNKTDLLIAECLLKAENIGSSDIVKYDLISEILQ